MWDALYNTIAVESGMSEADKAVLFDQLNSATVEMTEELFNIYVMKQY